MGAQQRLELVGSADQSTSQPLEQSVLATKRRSAYGFPYSTLMVQFAVQILNILKGLKSATYSTGAEVAYG